VQFFKRLQRLAERAELPVDEPQIEDSLHAVCLDADCLQIQLLRALELAALLDERVSEVDERARIVAVVADCEGCVL
jgi:hypothetical protein